jgi:2-methylcitrate dehydratase PrpD
METVPIARVLARFIDGLAYEHLPGEILTLAKARLLDSLGACIAGRDLPWSQMALTAVQDSQGTATIIGQDRSCAVGDAAFVNGVLAHSVMQEDSQKVGGHPSTIVVPAGLMVAEQLRSSGRQFLVSIVIGYEVMNRITAGTPAEAGKDGLCAGFRNSTVFGIFGAAAAAAKLMKLSEEQMVHAIGYAANLAAGLTAGFAAGTMEHMFQAGLAAQNAITAVRIARSGATASETTLEGKHGFYRSYAGSIEGIGRVTIDLGKSFAIRDVWSKYYPAAGFNQESIALGQELMAQHRIHPADIQRVVEKSSLKKKGYAGADTRPPYRNVIQALLSGPFCLAAALLGKPVSNYRFFYDHYDDPEVAELAPKIDIVGEEGRKVTRIEIHLQDGTQYGIEKDASNILVSTWDNMEAKFRKLAAASFPEKRVTAIVDRVRSLDQVENLQDLTRTLRGGDRHDPEKKSRKARD